MLISLKINKLFIFVTYNINLWRVSFCFVFCSRCTRRFRFANDATRLHLRRSPVAHRQRLCRHGYRRRLAAARVPENVRPQLQAERAPEAAHCVRVRHRAQVPVRRVPTQVPVQLQHEEAHGPRAPKNVRTVIPPLTTDPYPHPATVVNSAIYTSAACCCLRLICAIDHIINHLVIVS